MLNMIVLKSYLVRIKKVTSKTINKLLTILIKNVNNEFI